MAWCRLRGLVWGLAGMSLLTCLVSFRWFSPLPTSSSSLFQIERQQLMSDSDPSGYSETQDVSKVMGWRQEAVREACSEGGDKHMSGSLASAFLARHPKKLINFIVDDKNRVLYCYVPKVACTNWKRVMLILSGASNKTDPKDIPADSVHRRNVFVKLSDLKPKDIEHRLNTYTKFLFVRHPIERVISAFRNKFEKNYTSSAYFKRRFGVKIIKKYRKDETPTRASSTGNGVRFPEFVSYLIDTREELFNEHWALFSSMCFPCELKYDFIGKYETLSEDSSYILQQIGAPSSLHFPEVVPSKTTSVVETYFNSLTDTQQTGLVKVYKDDFEIFDYHFKDFI